MNALDRIQDVGLGSASPFDLLAVALARRESDVDEDAARRILGSGRIRDVSELDSAELRDGAGLEPFEALRFRAAVELGRRAGSAGSGEKLSIDDGEDVLALFADLQRQKQEHFCILLLNAKMQVIRRSTIHIGSQTSSMVSPADVFREAIREGAVSIIVVHNHPSGDPTPSPEDILVTDKLVALGKELGVPVIDHIVIGERRHVSMKERGLVP